MASFLAPLLAPVASFLAPLLAPVASFLAPLLAPVAVPPPQIGRRPTPTLSWVFSATNSWGTSPASWCSSGPSASLDGRRDGLTPGCTRKPAPGATADATGGDSVELADEVHRALWGAVRDVDHRLLDALARAE